MTTYKLHGRELKIGDRVWMIDSRKFSNELSITGLDFIHRNQSNFAWDAPRIELAKIDPPLGFTSDGLPIRKGDPVMVLGTACIAMDERMPTIFCQDRLGNRIYVLASDISFDFPTAPPKRKVLVEFWINKYGADKEINYDIACIGHYSSKELAIKHSSPNCQGQEKFSYYVEINE